ncbi:hypothetical protein [Pontiella sulfatireligans]|uniref:hypothetical protein n=1 Tax=Pontiella sulfatireligans TaxID=2750658 RepID=UPI00109C5746|nr:hypothetical protein [Pontiella sulfatireligans]
MSAGHSLKRSTKKPEDPITFLREHPLRFSALFFGQQNLLFMRNEAGSIVYEKENPEFLAEAPGLAIGI